MAQQQRRGKDVFRSGIEARALGADVAGEAGTLRARADRAAETVDMTVNILEEGGVGAPFPVRAAGLYQQIQEGE